VGGMNVGLAFLLASMAACSGNGAQSAPPHQGTPPTTPDCLSVDLSGTCRADPPTPGALEAVSGKSRPRYQSMRERLLALSYLCPESGCWIWVGKVNRRGYGHITVHVPGKGPRNRMAHRVAYEVFRGEKIPDDMTLDHAPTCATIRCIHPDHLTPVTREENTKLARARERVACGELPPPDETIDQIKTVAV
jgi:hypothetical protein